MKYSYYICLTPKTPFVWTPFPKMKASNAMIIKVLKDKKTFVHPDWQHISWKAHPGGKHPKWNTIPTEEAKWLKFVLDGAPAGTVFINTSIKKLKDLSLYRGSWECKPQ